MQGDGEGCESKKTKKLGKARVTRAREKLVLIFLSDEQEKKERSKKVFLENSCQHATRNWKWWKAVVHPWRNGQMFRVEVWQQANPKGGEEEGRMT